MKWVLRKVNLEKYLKQAEENLENYLASPEVAMEKCFQAVMQQAKTIGVNDDNFHYAISLLQHSFRNKAGTKAFGTTIQAHWLELALPFCTFDAKSFEAAFRKVYPEVAVQTETQRLKKNIQNLRKDIQKHLVASMNLLAGEDDRQTVESMGTLAETFVLEWKNAARSYRIPVDINGVQLIGVDEKWREAYNLLSLSEIPKSPTLRQPIMKQVPSSTNLPLSTP